MGCVRVLVDGNNVMYALRDAGVPAAGRAALCRLLGDFAAQSGLAVAVVFDGAAPREALAEQLADPRIEVHYSGRRTADEVLGEMIDAHTAPRRLTLVSSDHEVRAMARRRRCGRVDATTFALRLLNPPPPRPAPVEPPEKRAGLEQGEVEQWLAEFGFQDEPGGAPDEQAPRAGDADEQEA